MEDAAAPRSPLLVPGCRGAQTGTRCCGEFLAMLGHYGWIMSSQAIDHPDTDRHGGRIYLGASDVRHGAVLTPGCRVSFWLYADENGLGAADCHLVDATAEANETRQVSTSHHLTSSLRTPLRSGASRWQPSASASMPAISWRQPARAELPGRCAMVTLVPADVVTQWFEASLSEPQPWTCAQNVWPQTNCMEDLQTHPKPNDNASATLDGDDSDDDEMVPLGMWSSLAARCSRAIGDAAWADTPRSAVDARKFRTDSRGSEASTNTGESSDSDSYGFTPTLPATSLRPPPGLEAPAMAATRAGAVTMHRVRSPPGLELYTLPVIA